MKIDGYSKIVGLSLVTAMLLGSSAYAGKIIGADANQSYDHADPLTQYGFGGWNFDNVDVYITDLDYVDLGTKSFDETDGTYDAMVIGDSFESQIMTDTEHRGNLHGKDWPVGEPAGVKIINDDNSTKNGKPENCILTTSYLTADKNGGVDGLLNSGDPAPVICSSPFQSHKRFKINMLPSMVVNPTDGYGQPVDLVFDLNDTDASTEIVRYQVFQKINNYTGMRLDGYKIEVLDATGQPNDALTLSLGIDEDIGKDGNASNIWSEQEMANYSHGLWGPETFEDPPHFPTDGFFDKIRAYFPVQLNEDNNTALTTNGAIQGGNYDALFGNWLPSKWQPVGIFWDDDNDPTTDAQLVAFWGTSPDAPNEAPAWHKGMVDNWAAPTDTELLAWYASPVYSIGFIEDTLNLGLNYIVNVGTNAALGNKFTIRITPHISADQTPPSYADENGTIVPEPPFITDGTVAIIPAPTFVIGDTLTLSVKDEDQNIDPSVKDTTTVTVTTDNGDKETVILMEDDVNSSVFIATIASELTTTGPTVEDGKVNVIEGAVVTVSYVDNIHTDTASTTATIADDGVTPPDDGVTPPELPPVYVPVGGGGGGCTYNPNSNSFDMTFLFMMALGLLYPFRRRFLK